MVLIYLPFNLCTNYYLKIGGYDSGTCSSYSSACGSFNYIKDTFVNINNANSTVFIDSGVYTVDPLTSNSRYNNLTFNLTGNTTSFSSSFSSSDINTYPVIYTNQSDLSSIVLYCPFVLNDSVSSSFYYLKFLIGSNSHRYRYFIDSFFTFLFKYIL
jgi:hypothetical protein